MLLCNRLSIGMEGDRYSPASPGTALDEGRQLQGRSRSTGGSPRPAPPPHLQEEEQLLLDLQAELVLLRRQGCQAKETRGQVAARRDRQHACQMLQLIEEHAQV